MFRNRLAFTFCENYFECRDRRVTDHLSITMAEMLGVFYFVFTVYRTIDLCLDLYWWNHFESPTYFFTGTCILGAAFNLWYIFRGLIICRNFEQIDPAKAINIFAELDFHVVEGIVNFVQIFLGVLVTFSDKSCIDSINFTFECFCCCGVVLQLPCFLKNFCVNHGEEKQSYCVNIIGVLVSLVSAGFGCLCVTHVYHSKATGWRNC